MISDAKIFAAALLIFLTTKTFAFEANDISVLLPLPDATTDSALIDPQTVGGAGPLIPEAAQTLISNELASLDQFRVVALRVDPCFPNLDLAHPENCRAQIRLIWQLLAHTNDQIATHDSAIHTFYEISQIELRNLLREIGALRAKSPQPSQSALSVHPIIAQQGLHGDYWRQLKSLVLSLTGASRLSRFTIMEGANPYWRFLGFDVDQGKPSRIAIPLLGQTTEVFSNFAEKDRNYLGGLGQKSQGPDEINDLLTNSRQFTDSSKVQKQKSMDAIFRIENPRFNNPETINCSSCHVAQGVRSWAQRNTLGVDLTNNPFRFVNKGNTAPDNTYSDSTIILRNFGYSGRAPAISQRVVNETNLIVEQLNAQSQKQ